MKLKQRTLAVVLALGAAAMLTSGGAEAATAANGDILLGFRATGGTGSTKNLVVNLGAATALENATGTVSLGNLGTDLANTYGSEWKTRSDLFWGAAGTVGSFTDIGTNPAKTVYGSSVFSTAWTRKSNATHGAVTNKMVAMMTAFNSASSAGLTHTSAVQQTISDSNSWSSYQPGGTTANSGPAPGTSFAFFNPTVEASFEGGTAGAALYLYRVKPAVTGADIDAPGNYLGQLFISDTGALTYQPDLSGPAVMAFAQATQGAAETAGQVTLTLSRGGNASGASQVSIAVTGGTAVSGTDYEALAVNTVSFSAGQTERTVSLTLLNRPGIQGDRTVVLTLSNAVDGELGAQTTTTLTISDTVVTSTVQLVNATLRVNAEAGAAAIQLERSGGTDPVEVEISTTNGTALAGTDFTAPAAGTRVSFAEGETTASYNVPLTNPAIAGNRTFSVSVAKPGDGPSYLEIGGTSTTAVTILAQDSTLPTLAFTAPAAGQRIEESAGASVQVRVQAQDNIALEKVEISLNGGAFVNATLSGGTYNRTVTAVGGINTVVARATDSRGNEATATRQFTFVRKGSLTVAVNPGDGSRGTVSAVTRQGSSVAIKPGEFETGTTYVVRATPKAGSAFSGWTVPGLTNDPSTRLPTLVFVYTEAIRTSPTLTAAFTAAPFTDAEIGEFNGLVRADTGFAESNSTSGFMKVTLTSKGTFTGTLLMDGFKLTVPAGSFTADGLAYFGADTTKMVRVERTTKPAIELSEMNWDADANEITGTVTLYYRRAVASRSTFTLKRAAFTAKAPMPAASPFLANKGVHNVVIPAKDQTNGLTSVDYPQGAGVGSIKITGTGTVSLAARLADDTAITVSVPVNTGAGSTLQAPLFAQLYGSRGSFGGLLILDASQADSDMKAVDCLWYRPWQNAMQWYPWGWEEGVKADLYASSYDPARAGGVVPGLPAIGAEGNADLVFSGGLLAADVSARLAISDVNKVTSVTAAGAADVKSYSVKLTAASGELTGTFTHSDGTKPKFNGRVYQKGPFAGAHGYFLSGKPKVVDGLGESGPVELVPLQ
ncbi:MAG: hypothetical protein CJBNEKGG_00207 [Prosthecobacter sp.]|nr:hypothetical protein [Prosthecobacter sp.]